MRRHAVLMFVLAMAVIFMAGCASPAKQDGIPAGQRADRRAEADGRPADAGHEAVGVLDLDRIFITLLSVWMGMYGPGLWWSLDPGGGHYGLFSLPNFAPPLHDYTAYQVTSAAPDGKAMLLTFYWTDDRGGIMRSAVARLDRTGTDPLAAARMISPEEAGRCDGGHFSRDGQRIFFIL